MSDAGALRTVTNHTAAPRLLARQTSVGLRDCSNVSPTRRHQGRIRLRDLASTEQLPLSFIGVFFSLLEDARQLMAKVVKTAKNKGFLKTRLRL
ncbi:MAG: hypothetical protein AAGJ87_12025 [Pseudomonadota bacterium]